MSIEFEDATGKPVPKEDIEAALAWATKKVARPDFKDPEGFMMLATIRYALQEVLAVRAALERIKAENEKL